MNQRNNDGSKRSKWGAALALLWVAACGGAIGGPHVGGESHFLLHCGDGCGPGLECVSDVCTRACRIDGGDCSDLADNAKCTNDSIEPGSLAVCDVACKANTDCNELGSGFTCESGFCRHPIQSDPGNGTTGGSASGGSASGGSVSGGSASGGSASGGSSTGPEVPAARCLEPFVQGTCEGLFKVFAFEDGACVQKIYGGCDGNDNRFGTIEQCWAECEGRPSVAPCPEGLTALKTCLECGPAGGCSVFEDACASSCGPTTTACPNGMTCQGGFCQVGPCF